MCVVLSLCWGGYDPLLIMFLPFQETITVIPEDQMQLSEKEMAEEHTRILRASDPNAPENIALFSFTELTFKHEPSISQLTVHLDRSNGCVSKYILALPAFVYGHHVACWSTRTCWIQQPPICKLNRNAKPPGV